MADRGQRQRRGVSHTKHHDFQSSVNQIPCNQRNAVGDGSPRTARLEFSRAKLGVIRFIIAAASVASGNPAVAVQLSAHDALQKAEATRHALCVLAILLRRPRGQNSLFSDIWQSPATSMVAQNLPIQGGRTDCGGLPDSNPQPGLLERGSMCAVGREVTPKIVSLQTYLTGDLCAHGPRRVVHIVLRLANVLRQV